MPDDRTHWEGCWRMPEHHECAKVRLRELATEVLAYERIIDDYGRHYDFFDNKRIEIAQEVLRDEHSGAADV